MYILIKLADKNIINLIISVEIWKKVISLVDTFKNLVLIEIIYAVMTIFIEMYTY